MQRAYVAAAAVALLVVGATACGPTMTVTQHSAMTDGKIEVGMTRIEVERKLGFPQRIVRVGASIFLFYKPAYYFSALWIDDHNPIAIEHDKVVGIGKAYYEGVAAKHARYVGSELPERSKSSRNLPD
jgi:hypothetical protein